MGRDWASPSGNLYVSTIIRLGPADPPPSTLAFVAALAVHASLAAIAPNIRFQIKWPNDILSASGAKLCGILLERSGDAVIAGIGVNLTQYPKGLDRAVTSLSELGIVAPHPQFFTENLAAQFARLLGQWRMFGLPPILSAWRDGAHPPGTKLSVHLPDSEAIAGEYAGLTDDGALMLRLADGAIRVIHAADIFLT